MRAKLLLILACLLCLSAAQAADWNISRGGPKLHGVTAEPIPLSVKQKWAVSLGKELKASPVIVGNRIVIGSTDGTVYCLNMAGKILWKFTTDNAIEGSALILNNRVYVGNLSGNLYALDLITGRKIWTFTANNQFMAGVNWWSDGKTTYLLVGNYDYFLYCINAATGKMLWKYEAQNYLNATVAVENGYAAFGGCDGSLHVVNIKTGKVHAATPIATYVASSVALENGLAYVGDYDGKVNCYDYINKRVKWTFDLPEKEIPFVSAPTVLGNRVMIGGRDRYFYCLNKQNGTVLWKTNLGNPLEASAIADSKNVLVGNMRGDLILLNQTKGAKLWIHPLGSPMVGNPALSNGHLVVGATNGKLYCLIKK